MSKLDKNDAIEKKQYFLPDIADIIFFFILWLVLFLKENMLLADGSTGWHIVTGNYILQYHTVPHTDLMSYTFANKPWIAYEWLSDVFMAWLVKLGGLNLLNVVAACAIALLVSLIYRRCRENNCNFAFATCLTIIGSAVAAIHWLARPHIFAFFGIYIFTTLLDRFYQGLISAKKLILFLTLTMLVWVNTHPSFPIGFVLIAIYLFSLLLEYLFFARDNSKPENSKKDPQIAALNQIKTLSFTLALNIVASFCNPYGYNLYSYIYNYLFKTNAIVSITDEFLSPIFHGALQPFLLELLFAFTLIGLLISKRKISFADLLVYLFFAHLSLSAQRNMAFYPIAALPIIARLYSSTEFDPHTGTIYKMLHSHWQIFIDKAHNLNEQFTKIEKRCSYHLLPIIVSLVLMLIALNGGKVFCCTYMQAAFPKDSKPDSTLVIIKQLHLDPKHGFSLDNWGGVIKYQIDYPVFIDDRADFYGEDFYSKYGRILQLYPGWQKELQKYQINWVLLPKDCRLIEQLKADNQWEVTAEDKASTLMLRRNANNLSP